MAKQFATSIDMKGNAISSTGVITQNAVNGSYLQVSSAELGTSIMHHDEVALVDTSLVIGDDVIEFGPHSASFTAGALGSSFHVYATDIGDGTPLYSLRFDYGLSTFMHLTPDGIMTVSAKIAVPLVQANNILTQRMYAAPGLIAQDPSLEFGLVGTNVGALKIKNTIGEVRIGQVSTTYAYFETNANNHYFNKPLSASSHITIDTNTVTVSTPPLGYTNNSTLQLGCDHRTTWKGSISRTVAFATGSGNPIFTINTAAARPPYTVVLLVPGDACIYQLYVTAAGVVYVNSVLAGSAGTNMYLDGITFPRS